MSKTIAIISGLLFLNFSFPNENKPLINENEMVTLHFTSDNRLPYKVGVPFISYNTCVEAVHGLLAEPTDSHIPNFKSNISSLELAEPIAADPRVIRLILKKNLYFDDGESRWEATSDDLKFSLARFFFTKLNINAKHRLSNIENTENIVAGSKYDPNLIPSIKIINKYEINIKLKIIDPTFLEKISHSGTPLVSIKTLKDNYFSWKKLPVGVGPYKIIYSNLKTGETILEKRDDSHFPNAQKYIRFISSSDSEGDIFWKDMWKLDQNKFKKEILKVSYGTLGIFFNFDSKLGMNENFRKAVSLIINRNELVNGLNYLTKNSEILPISTWGRVEIDKKRDLHLAKKYINKVPKNLIKDMIDVNTFGQSKEAVNKPNFINLKKQLEELGININFKLDDGKLKLDSPMFIVGVQAIHKDPSYVFGYFRKGSFYKTGYPKENKFIEENFNKLISSQNLEEQTEISKKISEYLTENAIVIPLWDLYSLYTYDSQKINANSFYAQPGGMRFKVWEINRL